ncbi:hypothetical protein BD324DRAFT_28917 [Kockovaella imperatae]|uniref:Ysc84 actin-binding domain-containing protein n=1 Tax=Kockovaella imperatae TaxID=4999 RepID=A0A1Y1UUQ8_9TREE|nr:hypothetical protein BD324DRAFT_28917 [Kockovaella imperatae]ORX40935.1 hypothetical protein BD324DRAFT_28917 [Kockovaella imperatae]
MGAEYQPPPRRTAPAPAASTPSPEKKSWKDKMRAAGKTAVDKGMVISDKVGGRVNDIAEKRLGTERFWPTTGDFPQEMEKAARILTSFTVDGVVTEVKDESKLGKKVKMLRKIPAKVFKDCKGVAIFTAMRTGIAPLGGAGGAGIVIAKLEDGSWSAPASITPNNLSTGFLIGVDVYDCVLIIRDQKALDSFRTHKFTLGAEIGVAAGPYGGGRAVEAGIEKAPVLSYVRSKGMYAGVELVGQVFVERFDENANMYHWPGVKAGDILAGKVKVPQEAGNLIMALMEAESGRAQQETGAMDVMIGAGPHGEDVPVDDEGVDVDEEKGEMEHGNPEGKPPVLPPREPALSLQPPPLHPSRNPTGELMRPPLGTQHSSASHYSDMNEAEPAPPLDQVREVSARMDGTHINGFDEKNGHAKENDVGAVYRQEGEAPPPEYDESLR